MNKTQIIVIIRGSVMSGTDLTSYSALNLNEFQLNRRSQIQRDLEENA